MKIETQGIVTLFPDEMNLISAVGGTTFQDTANPGQSAVNMAPPLKTVPHVTPVTEGKCPIKGQDPSHTPGAGTEIPGQAGSEGGTPIPPE